MGYKRGGGHVHALLLLIPLVHALCHAEMADMAIVESPQSFTLYNQFEQPVSASEKADILPFSPFQIIRPDTRLGDQITRAMQCLFRQKTYYLLKDEQGAVIGNKEQLQLLKGCTLMGDTVEIMKAGAVAFSQKGPSFTASRTALPNGARLIVLFRYRNAYFSMQIAPEERFGWVVSSSRDAWKRVKQAASIDTSITENLLRRLIDRIESANVMYKTFFDRFNGSTGQQKSIPRWSEVKSGAECSWSLSEPYGHTGELDESIALLVEDLRDILLGKPFSIRYEKGRITFSPKAAAP